jgi:hypothetical protein
VSQEDAELFAKQHQLAYFETSTAENLNVEAPFYYIAHTYNERFQDFLKETKKFADTF